MLLKYLLVFFASILTPLLTGFVTLYLVNQGEFQFGLISLCSPALATCFLVALGTLTVFFYLSKQVQCWIVVLLLILGGALFLQGNFFVWNYGVFDGTPIKWNLYKVNGIIEVIFWGSCFVFGAWQKDRILRHAKVIALILILAQWLPILPAFKTIPLFSEVQRSPIDPVREFSQEQNLLMVILDGFAAPIFDQLIKEYPDIQNRLNGFIYYQDTLTAFATTAPSIPSMFSGKKYDNKVPFNTYLKDAISTSSPNAFTDLGWDTSVVSLPQLCEHLRITHCMSVAAAIAKDGTQLKKSELAKLFDLWLFRYSPHFLKPYIYNDDLWLLQQLYSLAQGPRLQAESLLFAKTFTENISAAPKKSTFKILHLLLPHSPLRYGFKCEYIPKERRNKSFDSSKAQAYCAMTLALDLIEKIKSLGIWDKTSVVITADHGVHKKYLNYELPKGFPKIERALPLLLIKPQNNTAPFSRDDKAISLIQLPEILNLLAIKGSGEDFSKALSSQDVRTYRHYQWKNRDWFAQYLPPMTEYIIKGHAHDIQSWQVGERYEQPK